MKIGMKLSSIASILMIWYLIYLWVDHPVLMPSIQDTLIAFLRLFGSRDAVFAMTHTFVRLGISIGISLLLALILAFSSYVSKPFEDFIQPYVIILKTVPLVSVIMVMYVLIHYSLATYAITFLMIFPLLFQAILTGLKQIDASYIDVYKLEAGHLSASIQYLYGPMVLPYVVLGLLQSLGLGLKVIVMAEFITQHRNGIGRLLYQARTNLAYDQIFAITIVLIIVTALIESGIKRWHTHIESR